MYSRLPTDQDQNASRNGEDRDDNAQLPETDERCNPIDDQKDREQEHSKISGDGHDYPPWVIGLRFAKMLIDDLRSPDGALNETKFSFNFPMFGH